MVRKSKNNNKQEQKCQGYYEVSGYTTKDGKHVDDYIRQCWKHTNGGGIVDNPQNVNSKGISDEDEPIFQMPQTKENTLPTDDSIPSDIPNDNGTDNPLDLANLLDLMFSINTQRNGNGYYTPQPQRYGYNPVNYGDSPYQKFPFSTYDTKKTETDIKNSMKNTENILKQKIITKEDIAKVSNQTQIVMHNLFDDIEDLSVLKSNLPEIPTIESVKESQRIEKDREQIRENAYQTILLLYQQRNVIEKQWKKVSTKDDDYDNKFNQYIANKQEIERLCDTAKELFDNASKIDDTTLGKIKKLRDELGLMRFRPMLPKKQVAKQQKWIWPCESKNIRSSHGMRMHPIRNKLINHDGIDIAVPVGTAVNAVADGKVVKAQWNGGYGNYIEIDHGNGLISFYGHLNSYNVKAGDYVKQGQVIAKSGNTGGSTGPHLHFGVHKNGKSIDPMLFYKT